MSLVIRDAAPADVPRLLEIYTHYVNHTAISFEITPPDAEEFSHRMREVTRRYPYLVAELDGVVQGYAYAHSFIAREAYDWCCELTIYLDPTARRCGLGRALYTALEERLRAMGILNLYTCVGVPEQDDEYLTHNSMDFHEHLGFRVVGTFQNCGRKFDRWYHMVWMEKLLGKHSAQVTPVAFADSEARSCKQQQDRRFQVK